MTTLHLHAIEHFSQANGPGLRAAIWFQGCTLGCPGCFNPATHDPRRGRDIDTEELVAEIRSLGQQIEGVSISGGEPFQQPEALLELLIGLEESHLSRLVFSGYRLSEIEALPLGPEILRHIDVLIAGRYVDRQHVGQHLLGSTNQQIHLLTNRYSLSQVKTVPRGELILHPDGSVTATGILPWNTDE